MTRIGPALDTLKALPAAADIDLVFIDADKPGYAAYWAELVPRVRPGGLLLADNVLWSGQITDLEVTDANITALRTFNDLVASDDRVDTVVLTAFDGLTIAGGGDPEVADVPAPGRLQPCPRRRPMDPGPSLVNPAPAFCRAGAGAPPPLECQARRALRSRSRRTQDLADPRCSQRLFKSMPMPIPATGPSSFSAGFE